MSEEEPELETPLPTMPESEPLPETMEMPVTSHIPITIQLREITHVPAQESVLETTDRPETTHMAEPEPVLETMGMLEATDLLERMHSPEIIGMFDTMDMPESMNSPEIAGLPQVTEVSETTYVADTMPESMNMPQTTTMSETTHMADTMPESTDMPEPGSMSGTMVILEANPAVEETPDIEDSFPMEPGTRDSQRGTFWEHVLEPQSFVTRSKKRPSSSPTLPPKKRARSTLLEATCHAPDGIYDTLSEMRRHEITLQKRVVVRDQERAAFQDSTRSYIEQQALSSLESKVRCLRRGIQTLERDRVPIKERIEQWEKLRSSMRSPDTAKMRGLDTVNRELQENTTAISNAEKTLQQTIEALDRQKTAGEKLSASVEENYNEASKQLLAWQTLMKLVHGFPSSMDKVNAVLKMQETCLEELAFSNDKQEEEEEEDDSGIDEPLIKTPDLPHLPGWDPFDGSASLSQAPLHNDI
ncbi:hypothetical protein NW768_010571 [Fusarium equiseti]|uniref:Uncharacterized protein n=1 Tax=Fusarium equiseti TaxID=61235 RepID=A0ABQ8QZV4_FUSEQ|nr:hypothetical protein NW768_010571 [Fusarium equiseti]